MDNFHYHLATQAYSSKSQMFYGSTLTAYDFLVRL